MINDVNAFDNTGLSMLAAHLGPTWDFFESSITKENAERFNTAYNLVSGWEFTVPDDDEGDTPVEDESTLGIQLQHILLDESLTIPMQTQQIRALLLNNIIDCLTKAGLTLDKDQITIDHFDVVLDCFDLLFVMNQFEDLQSLSEVLEIADIPAEERFMELMRRVKGYTESELEPLYYIITDASDHLMETLRLSLIVPDPTPEIPQYVITRVKRNRTFLLKDTLAGAHVKGHGALGMGINSLRSFYATELIGFRDSLPMEYMKQVIAFTLISDLKDDRIGIYVADFLKAECDDLEFYYKAEALLQELGIEVKDE